MIVRDFQLTPQQLRLRTPLVTARGTFAVRKGAVIALGDGVRVGLGEATPLEGDADQALAVLVRAGETLVGKGMPESPAELDAALEEVPGLDACPSARHALESALFDLCARRLGMPVARFLSRKAATSVPVNALLGAREPEALAMEGRRAVEEGFGTLKVKVAALSLDEDDARLAALRAAVGPEVKVRIDANGGWNGASANEALSRLARHDLEICEQPVGPQDLAGLRAVKAYGAVPIAADESAFTLEGAHALLRDGALAVDALVLRPMVLGGMWRALCLAREAAEYGVGAWISSSLDGVVARAAAAHLSAVLPLGGWAHGLGVGSWIEGLDEGSYAPVRGEIRPSSSAGFGLAGRIR